MVTLSHYEKYTNFSLKEYQDYQLQHLNIFLNRIRHTRYFSKLLSDFPQNITYELFNKIPFFEQELLRGEDPERFRSVPWNSIKGISKSSGSTGQSKIILLSQEHIRAQIYWGTLGQLLQGVSKNTRYAVMMPLELSTVPVIEDSSRKIGCTPISIGRLRNDIDVDNAIETIQRVKSSYMHATPSRLISLTERMIQRDAYALQQIPLSRLFVSGAGITVKQREYLETQWNVKVFDVYGSNEFGYIAFECVEHNGMHILPGPNYVEVIDPKTNRPTTNETEIGEVIITGFHNFGTPLLRYRIGDLGRISYTKCACGLHFPRLFITGRTTGTIAFGGTKIYAYQIENILSLFPKVSLYYKVVTSKQLQKELVEILVESCETSFSDTTYAGKIESALYSDSAMVYEIQDKIKEQKIEFKVTIVPPLSLARSNADKVKDQFTDLR